MNYDDWKADVRNEAGGAPQEEPEDEGAEEQGPPDFRTACPMAPDEAPAGWHETMPSELRCVYCGVTLAPVQCNGCGRFMSCEEIRKNESRCTECA